MKKLISPQNDKLDVNNSVGSSIVRGTGTACTVYSTKGRVRGTYIKLLVGSVHELCTVSLKFTVSKVDESPPMEH